MTGAELARQPLSLVLAARGISRKRFSIGWGIAPHRAERQRLGAFSGVGISVGVLVPAMALQKDRPSPAGRWRGQPGSIEVQCDLVTGRHHDEAIVRAVQEG